MYGILCTVRNQLLAVANGLKDWARSLLTPIFQTRRLTIPLLMLAVVCLAICLATSGRWSDFGLNALTEILGIILTVVFVDYLIRLQELRRTLPLQAAAYEDVRSLMTGVVRFWETAYKLSVPTQSPSTVEELFSLRSIDAVRAYLDLDSQPNVAPARTWWEYMPQQERQFDSLAERILERHAGSLDPVAYALVHQLLTGFLNPNTGLRIIAGIYQHDRQTGFPRAHNLASYWGTTENNLEPIIRLTSWCCEKKEYLAQMGFPELTGPIVKLNARGPEQAPRCMIDGQRLLDADVAVQAYRDAHRRL